MDNKTRYITDSIISDWDGWDGDLECFQLYNGKILANTKKFKKLDRVVTAAFLFVREDGPIVQLFDEEASKTGIPTEELPIKLWFTHSL